MSSHQIWPMCQVDPGYQWEKCLMNLGNFDRGFLLICLLSYDQILFNQLFQDTKLKNSEHEQMLDELHIAIVI